MAYRFNPFTGKLDEVGLVLTGTGTVSAAADGTAALPGIAFASDLNTGIYRPGADQVAISTNGAGRLFVDSSGNVGIGSSPISRLNALGAQGNWRIDPDYVSGEVQLFTTNVFNSGFIDYRIRTNQTIFDTGGIERARIDSSGRLGLGTSSPQAPFHLIGIDANNTYSSDTDSFLITAGSSQHLRFHVDQTNKKAAIQSVEVGIAGKDLLLNPIGGNVGIGTSSPNSFNAFANQLVVGNGSGNNGITVFAGNTSASSLSFADGTTGAESFAGYLYYNHSDDSLSFYVNYSGSSSPRMKIDSSGRVGIGTTSVSSRLHVRNPSGGSLTTEVSTIERDNSGYFLKLYRNAGSGNAGGLIGADSVGTYFTGGHNTNNQLYIDGVNGVMQFYTNSAERARIDSSGRLLVGTSTSRSVVIGNSAGWQARNQIASTSTSNIGLSLFSWSTYSADVGGGAGVGPDIVLARSNSNSEGTQAAVTNGMLLGRINFNGSDGTAFANGAYISAASDGQTWASGDCPARLVFSSTPSGSASPVEQLRITSDRYVRLASGTGGIQFNGDTAAANALDDYEEGTWTPNQGAGLTVNGTFSSAASYTKIGNTVHVRGYLSGSTNISVTAGGLLCTNLPFTSVRDGCGGNATTFNLNQTAGLFATGATTNLYSNSALTASIQIIFGFTYTAS